jgi:hypothetical protein
VQIQVQDKFVYNFSEFGWINKAQHQIATKSTQKSLIRTRLFDRGVIGKQIRRQYACVREPVVIQCTNQSDTDQIREIAFWRWYVDVRIILIVCIVSSVIVVCRLI